MQLSASTKIRARQLGWSEELIGRIEASSLKEPAVANLCQLHIAPERMGKFLELAEKDPDRISMITFKFARSNSERGVRAVPGPNGLGTPEINIGSYGQVPDLWPYENDTPLGSHPDPDVYMPGNYHIFDKSEVWAVDVDVLYEEAIRNRWVPATDLDWTNGLKELPEEMERAVGQLCTIYSSHGLVEQKIISKWFETISYGFHDVKLFLGTQVYDAGHKVEALRKRALANGGGLGQGPLGNLYRGWYGSLKFTELMIALNVTYKSYETTLFESAAEFVQTDVERKMFELLARDSTRHLEYGKRHLLWYLQHHPRAVQNVGFWLTRAENALSTELRHSHPERESLALLLAGDMERIDAGIAKLGSIRQRQLANYLDLLDSVGIDRLPKIAGGLDRIADEPMATNFAINNPSRL